MCVCVCVCVCECVCVCACVCVCERGVSELETDRQRGKGSEEGGEFGHKWLCVLTESFLRRRYFHTMKPEVFFSGQYFTI